MNSEYIPLYVTTICILAIIGFGLYFLCKEINYEHADVDYGCAGCASLEKEIAELASSIEVEHEEEPIEEEIIEQKEEEIKE